MTDVLDANPDIDEPAVPAEDPPQTVGVFDAFAAYYRGFVDAMLAGTPQTGGHVYNKIDSQQLRLKAADFAYDLIRRGSLS